MATDKTNVPNGMSEQQAAFGNCISTPLDLDGDDGYGARPEAYDPRILEVMEPNDRMTGPERLGIYNRQYWYRLFTIMQNEFPLLRHILGCSTLNELSSDYLQAYPSKTYDVSALGYRLAEFLQANDRWGSSQLSQAARLEWLVSRAFVAEQKPKLDPQALTPNQQLGLDGCKLTFQPYVHFFHEDWNVVEQHLRVKDDEDDELEVQMEEGVTEWIIFRLGTAIRMEPVELLQRRLLEAIVESPSLSDGMNATFAGLTDEQLAGVATDVQAWFSTWVSWGILVDPFLVDA